METSVWDRFTIPAESRYSLKGTGCGGGTSHCAVHKARYFVLECEELTVAVASTTGPCTNLKEKAMYFRIDMVWVRASSIRSQTPFPECQRISGV